MNSVSVLLPAAASTDPSDLTRAFESILTQSVEPDEVVLVTNQSLPATLAARIDDVTGALAGIRHEHFPDASGLGGVLQAGLESCDGRFVARMDADDVADRDRFATQLRVLRDGETDIVGAQLAEFKSDPERPERIRRVPTTHEAIAGWMPWRCPVNHPTVTFDRAAVLGAGGYRNVPMMEDWDLWARCLAAGLRFRNLDRVLVRAQVDGLVDRRGGLSYARAEVRMARELRRLGVASPWDTVRHIALRVPTRLLPAGMRQWVYRTLVR